MKKIVVGCLLASALVLGACHKSETKNSVESTEKSSSIAEKASSSSSTIESASHASSTIESSTATIESTLFSSSTLESTISSSSETQESTVASSEPNSITVAQQQLVGKSFMFSPSLYDGENVNQAMDEHKAPQNLVHDGMELITFTDSSTAHIELAGAYRPDYDTSYTLTNNSLIIDNNTIPYSVDNGSVLFNEWPIDSNGHTVTWSFQEY